MQRMVRIISHILLLMDDLEIKVNSDQFYRLWKQLTDDTPPDEDDVETLIYLWKTAQGNSACLRAIQVPSETPETLPFPQKLKKNQISNGIDEAERSALPDLKNRLSNQQVALEAVMDEDTLVENLPKGRYIYGIGYGKAPQLTVTGVEENRVYTIQFKEVNAIVHACEPAPYETADQTQAMTWIAKHQDVLDSYADHFQSIIPMGFDVIFDGSDVPNPDQLVNDWLEEKYSNILQIVEKLKGKFEYGIKAYAEVGSFTEKAKMKNGEIQSLSSKVAGMSKGAAYLYQAQLANLLRKAVEELQAELALAIAERIKPYLEEFREEKKASNAEEEQILVVNLSILTQPEAIEQIGTVLEYFEREENLVIDFTGPWPPYSFVGNLD